MVERPLHAVVLPVTEAGGQLLELLAAALDGTGPAVLPLDPDLPADRLAAILDWFAPAAVHTTDGVTRRADSAGGPGHGGSDRHLRVDRAAQGG